MSHCVQNTFKNDLKMAANWQFPAAYRRWEPASVCVSNGSLAATASGQCLTALIYHWGKNWDETGLFFPVLAVFQPSLFFLWHSCKDADMFYINLHFVVCLTTWRYCFIYVMCAKEHIQQIPRAVILLMISNSSIFLLNSSTNAVSKAIVLFILRPVKLRNTVI